MYTIKKLKLFFVLGISICFLICKTSFAESLKQESQDNVKKIIMMLNIGAKEFEEGVKDGKVVVAPEYKESQIFLQQAKERFSKISEKIKNEKELNKISPHFPKLLEMINNKADSQKVWDKVNILNSELMKTFEIEINKTPITPVSLENGKNIFEKNCSSCHGLTGNGDGPMAKNLNPSPAKLSDPKLTGDKNTEAYDNFEVINVGIANTGMKAWAGTLSEGQIWDVTYYIRTFSNNNVRLPSVNQEVTTIENNSDSKNTEQVVSEVRKLVLKSYDQFEKGKIENASESAFDAYMTYEKIESNLISQDKPLGVKLESAFSDYRGEIKRGAPLQDIKKLHNTILLDLSKAEELLKDKVGFSGLFLQSFSIIVREGFEAILIIAALIAFLRKSKNESSIKTIHIGVIVGILGSFLTAYVVHELLHLNMASQELLEGWIMLVSVVILFWVSYWLVSNIDNKKWQKYINTKMHEALSKGNTFTLSAVAFISVYREGFETVLFYKALFLYAGKTTGGIVPGFVAGCIVLAGVFYLVNHLGMRIPIKWFFGFTSVLLYYMAFTFMGKGIHELQMGEQFSLTAVEFLPSISWLGMYPTWETFIGQAILFLLFIFALVYTFVPGLRGKQSK
tara:strand:+ start:185 stop:2053 length:1869 start_codon:yes stop_codon:yes gene_type:complete